MRPRTHMRACARRRSDARRRRARCGHATCKMCHMQHVKRSTQHTTWTFEGAAAGVAARTCAHMRASGSADTRLLPIKVPLRSMRARHGGRRGWSMQSGITCASTCTPRTLGLHAGQRVGIPVPGPASSLSLHGQRNTTQRQAAPPTYGPITRGEGEARLPACSDARELERPGSRIGRFQLTSELPSRPDDQRACAWPVRHTRPHLHCQVSGPFGEFVGPGVPPWRKSQASPLRHPRERSSIRSFRPYAIRSKSVEVGAVLPETNPSSRHRDVPPVGTDRRMTIEVARTEKANGRIVPAKSKRSRAGFSEDETQKRCAQPSSQT